VIASACLISVVLVYLVLIWRAARPDRWMVCQFTLSVVGGILFVVAWNTFTQPLGDNDHSGGTLLLVAAFVGYWFSKSIMFCVVWARYGLPAARSIRLFEKRS
jgi:hypothetical protein